MNTYIQQALITRNNIEKIISAFSEEQINKTVSPFNNNLIWNYCHLIATQQLLTYGLSGLPTTIPMEEIDKYRKGTKPSEHVTLQQFNHWRELSVSTSEQLQKDLDAGIFTEYKTYQTSFGVELTNIHEALQFNTIHEGLHLGSCLAIRKFI